MPATALILGPALFPGLIQHFSIIVILNPSYAYLVPGITNNKRLPSGPRNKRRARLFVIAVELHYIIPYNLA